MPQEQNNRKCIYLSSEHSIPIVRIVPTHKQAFYRTHVIKDRIMPVAQKRIKFTHTPYPHTSPIQSRMRTRHTSRTIRHSIPHDRARTIRTIGYMPLVQNNRKYIERNFLSNKRSQIISSQIIPISAHTRIYAPTQVPPLPGPSHGYLNPSEDLSATNLLALAVSMFFISISRVTCIVNAWM